MPTYRFERITATARRRVTCPVCGKRRTVQHTLGQTVNPWHPAVKQLGPGLPDGVYYRAVRDAVNGAALEWQPSPVQKMHDACYEEVACPNCRRVDGHLAWCTKWEARDDDES